MEEPTGALAMAGRSCSPLFESLIHDPPPPSICLTSVCLRRDSIYSCPYEIVFSMSFLDGGKEADLDKNYDGMLLYKWYKMKIFAEAPPESEVPEIFPYWEGRLPQMSSFAALGRNMYAFGGQHNYSPGRCPFSPNLYLLDVFRWPIEDVFPAASMLFPRLDPQSLVLDGKLFILGGDILMESTTCWEIEGEGEGDACGRDIEGDAWYDEVGDWDSDDGVPTMEEDEAGYWSLDVVNTTTEDDDCNFSSITEEEEERDVLSDPFSKLGLYATSTYSPDIEVYDPITGRCVRLAEPPYPIESHFICAALENPSRILVASLTRGGEPFLDGKAKFFLYDVSRGYWKILSARKLHPKCPLGYDGGKALTVGNELYWITDDAMLLVYYLDDDLWLLGNLKGLGISFIDKCSEPSPPILLHLGDKRFAMVQCAFGYVHCVIIDAVHKPWDNSVAIFVVRTHKYKVDSPSVIQNCFLL